MENKKQAIEVYVPIKGYETEYEVSNLGNVKSLTKKDGREGRILKQENIVRSQTTYKRVTLSKDGIVKRFQVHRLVAMTFLPNPENKPQVNHIDFNGSNNQLSNLEWVTASENELHSLNNNPIKQKVLKQRHYETTIRMQKEQIERLDNWIGTTLGYATVESYTLIDKTVTINMRCNCCKEPFTYISLGYLRTSLKNKNVLACRSCKLKISRSGYVPETPYRWEVKDNLIDQRYVKKVDQ